jgi:hypothetical protein
MNNEIKLHTIAIYHDKEYNLEDLLNSLANMVIQKNKQLDKIKFYIEQSNIKDMLWGKEILKIIGENDE